MRYVARFLVLLFYHYKSIHKQLFTMNNSSQCFIAFQCSVHMKLNDSSQYFDKVSGGTDIDATDN